MTIQDIHTNILFYLDKLSTQSLPEITSEGIDLALNNTIESYIKTKYRPVKSLLLRSEGFESIQKRIDDLRVLVTTDIVNLEEEENDDSVLFINLNTVNVLNKYQFFLRGQVLINDKFTGIKIVKHDNLEVLKLDPFNQSIDRKPRAYFEGNKLYVLKTPNIKEKFKLTYLRRFREVNIGQDITIELSEHTHREIIQLCVQDLLEVIESPRINTASQKISNIE